MPLYQLSDSVLHSSQIWVKYFQFFSQQAVSLISVLINYDSSTYTFHIYFI